MQLSLPLYSPESYLGKEDFWSVGDNANISRRWTGTLFTQLVFPVRGYVETISWWDQADRGAEALQPGDIGLTVMPRAEAGMLDFAGSTGSPYPSGRQRLHRRAFGNTLTQQTAVIQAAGIIAVAHDEALIKEICNRPVREIVPEFARTLEALITPMNS